LLGDIMIFKIL